MRGCFLRPLLQPACGLIATTMSADSSSPSPAPASVDAAASGAGRARRGGKRQRPRSPAPVATTRDAAPGVAKAPRTPHPVLEQLAGLYPHLFGAVFRPLKRGIFQDLLAAHPDAFEREALKVALGIHTRSTRYLQAVAAGEKRHDLQGQPVEAMAPEHVHHALLEVYRRRKNQKGRSTEDLLPKLRNRIIAAFEASGLTREAYTELVVGRDDAANAILEEAFADMYGMDPRSTGQQLERARKLAAAAQGNPSASAPAV